MISATIAAARLGVSSRRVRELINQGRLPAQMVGSQWVINEADLELVQGRAPGRPKTMECAMEQSEFKSRMQAAQALSHQGSWFDQDFWAGYQRGLRRLHHGGKFGTIEEHERYLSLRGSENLSRHFRGSGYLAGFSGLDIDAAMGLIDLMKNE